MRLSNVAAIGATWALVAAAAPAHGQKSWDLELGLGLGALYTDKSLGPLDGDTAAAALRTSPILNASLVATTPLRWVRFRGALSTTIYSRLTAKTFSHLSSCGPNCRHVNFDHTPLSRGFNATFGAVSTELAPFPGASFSPYLEAGVGFKRLAFGDGPTDGFERLDGSMVGGVYLVGVGFEIPLRRGRFRFNVSDTFRGAVDHSHDSDSVIEQIEQSMRHDFRISAGFVWSPW
jgi:hypothetical protein